MRAYSVIVTIILLLISKNTSAQQLSFERITTEQGLSSNMVNCVLQDKNGFLWFGTNDGLNRYDGYKFTVIKHDNRAPSSLINNIVTSLIEDEKGNLWIGTREGLDMFNPSNYQFTHYLYDHEDENTISDNYIISLYQDKQGMIWAGTNGGGLNAIDKKEQKVYRYPEISNNVESIFEDTRENLWFGTTEGELIRYDRISKEFVKYRNTFSEIQPGNNTVWFIDEDRMGRLIVGMTSGLYFFDLQTENFTPFISSFGNLGSFRNNEIHCLYQDDPGKYWIGTWGKGFYIYEPKTSEIQNYRILPDDPFSLSNNDVNFIFEDLSGVIWIGTQDGINKLDPALDIFRHVQSNPNDYNSLSLNYVTSFEEQGNDILWIGTFGGGLNKYNRRTKKFTHYQHDPKDPKSLSNDAIRAIVRDHHGMLWIGTMDGLDMFNPKTSEFTHFRNNGTEDSPICGNDIMTLHEDHFGNLWVGTYGDGITRISPDRKFFSHFKPDESEELGLNSLFIRTITEDESGYIWIGCVEEGGVFRFDPKTQRFESFKNNPEDSSSLSNNNVNSIYEDEKGNLWVGTWDGLNLFDRKTSGFKRIGQKEGLPGNRIVEILTDDKHNLWISSHIGLSKIELDGENNVQRITNYTLKNGIQGNEFNINAKFKSQTGELYFGGTNGFNHFQPSEIPLNTFAPPVVITDFQVFNKSVKPGEKYDGRIIIDSLNNIPKVSLQYKDKIVSFEFSALSYSLPEKNTFKYKLEGIDKDWVSTSADRRFATYTNLEPGEYLFTVQASNNDGLWNQTGTSILIEMAPPFYRTWWAYMIYFLLIVLVLLGIRRVITIRMKLRNDLFMERMEREKMEEINQMKLRFFTNVSHEFKTPLTLILGPLEEMITNNINKDMMKNQLLIMHKNANRLLRLINQLMDFRKAERDALKLDVSHGDVIKYLKEISSAFDKVALKNKIDYSFISAIESKDAWFDADKLEKMIYNLLSNAFKFTSERGSISLSISFGSPEVIQDENVRKKTDILIKTRNIKPENDDFMIIAVKDTGIGISGEDLNHIFERFYQIKDSEKLKHKLDTEGTGIGLALTHHLARICKGEIGVKSTAGVGSEFVIRIPVKKEYFDPDHVKEELINMDKIHYEPSSYLMDMEENPPQVSDIVSEKKEMEENTQLVLIVEDNTDLRTFLRYKLEPVYKVLEAGDGAEGLIIAKDKLPDIIVSDIMMPEMDGEELTRELKSNPLTSHIPIILLTAKNSLENKIEGYRIGADDYIPKPFNPKLLAVRIKNLLESRRKLQEVFRKKLILEPKEEVVRSADDIFLEKAVKAVEDNIGNPEFNVDEFGRAVNMSRMQLYRKLKGLTSLSANEFIRTIRLKKAAQLLKTNNFTVSEVTYEVGFSDPKYFSKCFQKQYGLTPSKYTESPEKTV